jgi:hypothetical protein
MTLLSNKKVLIKRALIFIYSNFQISLIFTNTRTRIFCPLYYLSIIISLAISSQEYTIIIIVIRIKK